MITAVGIIDACVPEPDPGCADLVCLAERALRRRQALARTPSGELSAEARQCCQALAVCLEEQWWAGATAAAVRACYAQVRAWDGVCPGMAGWADHLEDMAYHYFGLCLDREWERAWISADLPARCPPAPAPVTVDTPALAAA